VCVCVCVCVSAGGWFGRCLCGPPPAPQSRLKRGHKTSERGVACSGAATSTGTSTHTTHTRAH
jgi:hypothetical protein